MKIKYLIKAAIVGCGILSFQHLNAQNLQNGLVAHFPLNGNGDDISTLSIDGTLNGTTPATGYQSLAGTALDFNIGDKLTANQDDRGITSQFSISVWVKTSINGATTHIVSKYNYLQDRGYYIGTYQNKFILAGRNGSNQFVYAGLGSMDVDDNNWHHVVATCDGSTWNLYVDCNLETSITVNSPNPDVMNNVPLTVGYFYLGDSGDYRYFDGSIDEVRIYNRVLDNSERSALCDVNLGVKENAVQEEVAISSLGDNQFEILWGSDQEYQVVWYDMTGKERGSRVGKGLINLENESSGIYILRITSESGELISQKKVVRM